MRVSGRPPEQNGPAGGNARATVAPLLAAVARAPGYYSKEPMRTPCTGKCQRSFTPASAPADHRQMCRQPRPAGRPASTDTTFPQASAKIYLRQPRRPIPDLICPEHIFTRVIRRARGKRDSESKHGRAGPLTPDRKRSLPCPHALPASHCQGRHGQGARGEARACRPALARKGMRADATACGSIRAGCCGTVGRMLAGSRLSGSRADRLAKES